MNLIAVAVPVPFLDLLTYRVPEPLPIPPVGARVRVPLGRRSVMGIVVQMSASAPEGTAIRDVAEVLDREPFLPPAVVDLCSWMADYYMAGIGDALATALPPGAQKRASGFKTRRIVGATAHGLSAAAGPGFAHGAGASTAGGRNAGGRARPPGSSQLAALKALAAAPAGLTASQLRELGFDSGVIARLVSRGLAVVRRERDDRDPFERAALAAATPDAARELTEEQDAAVRRLIDLAAAGEFRVALLHGVTGSGKTEIYLRLAGEVARSGRQVLVLVPEIALTPAAAAQFRGAFGARVAIQHSGLSDGERHDQWHRIRRGEVDVVVGTRSAVFAPLPNPGLIVVDEEHDTSYKQEESPRYHGRDVAVMRGSRAAALVVLGSATPSMETYQHALSGKYVRITLEKRVMGRPLAGVTLVNMRDEYAAEGPDIVVSRALVAGIEDRLARREQVLVLLNRRGYATAVFCRQCGDTFECPNCSVSLTLHKERSASRPSTDAARLVEGRARCHYCNYSMRVPKQCRACAAPYLEQAGFGTEKVEHQLRERFPGARIGRIDRDSVRRKGALAELLAKFSAGALDVIVGTQMIAKGHDFPRVTLVGVISADVGLGLADFRAGERTFQLLTQVAGRAGRGERTGEALVQTLYPGHYSIQLACRQDYPAFFERELLYRKGMRYPPVVSMVNVIVRGRTFGTAMGDAMDLARRLEPAAASGAFTILGPAPAPLGRLRGEHRVQLFLKGARRATMRDALRSVLTAMPEIRRRASVDVDPLTVL